MLLAKKSSAPKNVLLARKFQRWRIQRWKNHRRKLSTSKNSTLKNSTSKIFYVKKSSVEKSIVGNFNVEKFIVETFQRRQQFNVEMHQGQTIFTVRNFISCRRVWKLLDTILGNTLRCEKVWEGCRHFVLILRFGFLLCPIRQNRAIAATKKKNLWIFYLHPPYFNLGNWGV